MAGSGLLADYLSAALPLVLVGGGDGSLGAGDLDPVFFFGGIDRLSNLIRMYYKSLERYICK